MLNKNQRISTSRISWLLKKGARFSNEFFSIKFHLNKGTLNRYSVVVSKKILNLATDRNFLRRQLYEILRKAPSTVPSADMIISVKAPLISLSYNKKAYLLQTALDQIFTKIKQNNG